MSAVSRLHVEDGQLFVRVSAGHSISAQWLRDHVADLYTGWRVASDAETRDRLAALMEQRLEDLEPPGPVRDRDGADGA